MPRRRMYASNAERQAAYRCRQRSSSATQGATPSPPAVPSPDRGGWRKTLRQARLLAEQAAAEMHSYFESRSESWQSSERGEEFAEILDAVEDAVATLNEIPY